MAKRKTKVLLMALATVLCCLAILVVSTYALFTDTVSVDHHLQAGMLKAKLYRTGLTSKNLDETTGLLETMNIDDTKDGAIGKDFTEKTEDNIFGITEAEMVVPMSSFTAEMLLKNEGDVAFYYWIEIVLDAAKENGAELAEQIEISLTAGETTLTQSLSKGVTLGNSEGAGYYVLAGEAANFTVTITFLDRENNNDAQEQHVYFDLVVYAVQLTELP